jgi:glycosyltransferase involved in cell wall biosynthesis
VTETARIAVAARSGLDILVFVAHLELGAAELKALAARMLGELRWADVANGITLIVSDDSSFESSAGDPVDVVRSSMAGTMFRERCRVLEAAPHDVLIAFGPYLPTADVIRQLRVAVANEELVSAIAPRAAAGPNSELITLGPGAAPNSRGVIDARYACQLLPAYYFPELLCPCMLVSGRMVGNIEIPEEFATFPDLILAFLRAGRRRGFLIRVDNRLTVSADRPFDVEALPHETAKILQLFQDYELTRRRLAAHPAYEDERRFQALRRSSPVATGSLLLDGTNIPPAFSGSADHLLGVLKGMAKIEHNAWDLAAMVTPEARSFFSLDDRFPGIRFLSQSDESFHDCVIRLSQPWSISTLADLNKRGRCIAVTILDTIGPDVIYAVPEEAEEAFQFAAEHADGVVYISEFSRDQFGRRFVRRPGLVESVIYLSLDAAEYISDGGTSDGEWILIFGNAYDHKDLGRTTKIVSAAFPYEKIKVVGRRELGGLNVEAFDSGALENEVIEELFRRAKCVVFPSFYEGFGLPLMKGLAHGKAVIARRARVFREVVARFPNSGSLVEFENSLELVQVLGKTLHGKAETQSGSAIGAVAAHHGWKECAAQILQFAEQMRKSEDVALWRARDRALRYVTARRH